LLPTNQLIIEDHPDNFVINKTTGYGIDRVRQLITWIQQRPFNKKEKTAYILRAENLTIEAQNALLKTLEEPPDNTIVVLHTSSLISLLPTIVSRCIQLDKQSLEQLKDKNSTDWVNEVKLIEADIIGKKLPSINSTKEALQLSEELSKKYNRIELLLLVDEWIETASTQNTKDQRLKLESLLQAKESLTHNVSTQLALDNLLIGLSKTVINY